MVPLFIVGQQLHGVFGIFSFANLRRYRSLKPPPPGASGASPRSARGAAPAAERGRPFRLGRPGARMPWPGLIPNLDTQTEV